MTKSKLKNIAIRVSNPAEKRIAMATLAFMLGVEVSPAYDSEIPNGALTSFRFVTYVEQATEKGQVWMRYSAEGKDIVEFSRLSTLGEEDPIIVKLNNEHNAIVTERGITIKSAPPYTSPLSIEFPLSVAENLYRAAKEVQ